MENFEGNCVRVTMKRRDTSQPWGFRMTGGRDLGCFLHIAKVNPRSLSARFGLRAGDRLVMIEGLPAHNLNHCHAKAEILRAGNDLHLVVERGAVPVAEEEQDPMVTRRSVVVEEQTEYRGDTNPTSQSRTFYLLNQFLHDELEALPKESPKKAVVVNGPNLMAEHGPVSVSTYTSANRQPPVGIPVQQAPAPTMVPRPAPAMTVGITVQTAPAPTMVPAMATAPVPAPKPVPVPALVPSPKLVPVQAPVPAPKPVPVQAPVPSPKLVPVQAPVPAPKPVPGPTLMQGPTLVQSSTLVQESTLVQSSMQAPPPPQPLTTIYEAPAKESIGATMAMPVQAPTMKVMEKPATVTLPASQTVEKVSAINVQATNVAAPATIPVGSVMMSSEVVKEAAPKPAEVKVSEVVKESATMKAEVKSSDVVKESASKLAEVMSSEIVKEVAAKSSEAKSAQIVKESAPKPTEAKSAQVVQEAAEAKAEDKSSEAASLEAEADSSDVVIEVSPEDIQDTSTAAVEITEDTSATETVNVQVDESAPILIASAEEEEESFSFEISAEPADAETNFSLDLPAESSVEVNESADVEEPFTIVAIAENNEEDAEVELVGSVNEGSDEPETTFTLQL